MEFGRPVRLQGLGSTGAALVDVGVAVTDAVGEVVGVEFASAGVSSMMTISTAPSAAAAAAVDETLEMRSGRDRISNPGGAPASFLHGAPPSAATWPRLPRASAGAASSAASVVLVEDSSVGTVECPPVDSFS